MEPNEIKGCSKCDVCGKPVDSDKDQFVICKECREAMHSDCEEVGGEG